MRYLFGTGLVGVVTSGISLLRASKDAPFTWRIALTWASWAISVAMVIGAIVDLNRERHGRPVDYDSPVTESSTAKTWRKQVEKQRDELTKQR